MDKIEGLIAALVRERLAGAAIESITVEPDFDSDGDPVLKITVVFDFSAGELDADRIVGMVRHLKPKLAENKADYFPMFRFISKSDAEKLKHEAA